MQKGRLAELKQWPPKIRPGAAPVRIGDKHPVPDIATRVGSQPTGM